MELRSFRVVELVAVLILVQSLCCWTAVKGWDNAEFEMFDLVEELGQNFYEVLGVAADADDKSIRQAYRKLSIKLHPDKNPAEDASTKFRQLVGIYEVLKNKELRESYDKILVEGLPNWRQPIFYFRRARKLAIWQVSVIVLVIISVGQYLAGWASYFEKRLSMKEIIEARLRKTTRTKRGQKEGPTAAELEAEFEEHLPKPSLWNLAPFQICRGLKYLVLEFPRDVTDYWKELQEQKKMEEERAREEEERLEKERLKKEEPKKPKKRKTFAAPEKLEGDLEDTQPIWNVGAAAAQPEQKSNKPPVVSGGLWTDDDIAELSRLCSKFPGGTPNRWEKIAEMLNRPVGEVTFMSKKVLERLATKVDEPDIPQVKVKVKTKGSKAETVAAAATADGKSVENWTPEEQKALENALQIYPKGSLERWEKIARMVPSRTKEECMQRFKYVADMVKKKKESKTEEAGETKENVESSTPALEDLQPKLSDKESSTVVGEDIESSPGENRDVVKGPDTTLKKKKKSTKAKPSTKLEESKTDSEAPVLVQVEVPPAVDNSRNFSKASKKKSATDVPTAAPDAETAAFLPPDLTEEEIVALQLQSAVEECCTPLEDSQAKSKRTSVQSSGSAKSAQDDIVIVRRGSKEQSVERKNSTSSSTSEDWCVIESDVSAQH